MPAAHDAPDLSALPPELRAVFEAQAVALVYPQTLITNPAKKSFGSYRKIKRLTGC